LEEARRNLEAKFPAAVPDLDVLLGQLESSLAPRCFLPAEIAPELPEKDRPVLAAAIHRRCHVLLTGDKTHFGRLYGKNFEGVTIHSPASLATHLSGSQSLGGRVLWCFSGSTRWFFECPEIPLQKG